MNEVKEASARRLAAIAASNKTETHLSEEISDDRIDLAVDALLLSSKNVTPEDRRKLKGLLKYYAKKPHPFRACVRDNTKRFGPDGAKRICATLKDIIRGTTKWRGKNNKKDKGSAGLKGLSEDHYEIDDDLAELLRRITDEEIDNANDILLAD